MSYCSFEEGRGDTRNLLEISQTKETLMLLDLALGFALALLAAMLMLLVLVVFFVGLGFILCLLNPMNWRKQ